MFCANSTEKSHKWIVLWNMDEVHKRCLITGLSQMYKSYWLSISLPSRSQWGWIHFLENYVLEWGKVLWMFYWIVWWFGGGFHPEGKLEIHCIWIQGRKAWCWGICVWIGGKIFVSIMGSSQSTLSCNIQGTCCDRFNLSSSWALQCHGADNRKLFSAAGSGYCGILLNRNWFIPQIREIAFAMNQNMLSIVKLVLKSTKQFLR